MDRQYHPHVGKSHHDLAQGPADGFHRRPQILSPVSRHQNEPLRRKFFWDANAQTVSSRLKRESEGIDHCVSSNKDSLRVDILGKQVF
jgi:hypothetical protein